MAGHVFIQSIFTELEELFLSKKIVALMTIIDDEAKTVIDNVVYLQMDDEYVGILVHSPNPYFSRSFIDDFDAFNLYASYDSLKIESKAVDQFVVDFMLVSMNADYNELLGIHLSNSLMDKSLSIIFMYNELHILDALTRDEYLQKVTQTLRHVREKTIFLKEDGEDWVIFNSSD